MRPAGDLTLTARRRALFFIASSLVVLVCCGNDRGDEHDGLVRSAVSSCSTKPPKVGFCETAVCTAGSWDVVPAHEGLVCDANGGTCDAFGNCVPPPPPPSCDHPPPPRFLPGQNGNYPNGADVLSCTRPSAGVEAWHIDYPSVDQPTTDYPIIAFNAGDTVTLFASGCAQHGGSGNTWKLYVNPKEASGTESAQYYGTLLVPGVTGLGRFSSPTLSQPLEHWIGPAFSTPYAGHLVLGFLDDDYSGNGYWGHDDGDFAQCAASNKATVDIVIDHNARGALTCAQWSAANSTPVRADVPELAQIASLLRTNAGVPLGLPITADTSGTGLAHFQVFQDGQPGQTNVLSNRPLNSAELHSDGCVYTAYTAVSAPTWYPTDLAFDSDPNKGWEVRPWDPGPGNLDFGSVQTNNRLDPSTWARTFVPGTCGGSGTSWRSSAPRWIKACNLKQLPPSQWTAYNLFGFPVSDAESSKIPHSGAICDWHIKQSPLNVLDSCVDSLRAEWSGVYGNNGVFASAEGVVTNSFLSGGDYTHDHNGMPDGHFVGVHSDPLTHTNVSDCDGPFKANHGDHCADWELNLLPDANYRHLLAADESQSTDGLGNAACASNYADDYRKGNQKSDLLGALGIEGEQWYYPLGFRPEPGDRAVVRGSYIVDCGHPSWHTELHPASLVQSSFLQTTDYSPVAGATWNRPSRLTDNWRAITGGTQAVATKVVLSPVHAEGIITADIWPPARPCAGARLAPIAREYETPNPAWKGVTILSEQMLPAENPNHMTITFQRSPYTLHFGGDGDVQNPDPNLTFFQAYMAWWDTSGVACPTPGGPGSGACASNQGAACGSCGGVVQCDGSCSVSTPANLNASCGSDGGFIQCDSTCSVPAYGDDSSGSGRDAELPRLTAAAGKLVAAGKAGKIDLNGDGKTDICGRASSGLFCALSSGTSFAAVSNWSANFFSDSSSWNLPAYYSNIRYPDLNGDGKADVCGRGVAGFYCALSTGAGFGAFGLWGPAFSDAGGWGSPPFYSTLRFPDLNNDGKADVCGRGTAGMYCALSTGTGFGGLGLWGPAFSDAAGWGAQPYSSTLRFPDLNGDGKADVCGRDAAGIHCALSTGTGFGALGGWGPAFSDGGGWSSPQYSSTIRYPDLDGDGKADVCGRGVAGFYCALSTGTGFGALTQWDAGFGDANGWGSPQYYSTLRFPDVNGDGKADVCGRGVAGVYCEVSTGTNFGFASGLPLWGPAFSDANGWSAPSVGSTIQYADIDGDGKADVCGRGATGMVCALSSGTGFGTASVWAQWFTDAQGWSVGREYYSTIRLP